MDSQSWLSSCCGLLLQHTSKVDSIALTRLRGVLLFLLLQNSLEIAGNFGFAFISSEMERVLLTWVRSG